MAGPHRVAGVCGARAGARRAQRGHPPEPPVAAAGPHAGVRAVVPAGCDDRKRRNRRTVRRDSAPYQQRDPPRSRDGTRRRTSGSIPALFLELEHPHHGARPERTSPRI